MVGHTHEDVDTLFGHMWLRKHDALTLQVNYMLHCINSHFM